MFSVALAAAMILSVLQDIGLTRDLARYPTADNETVRHCTILAIGFFFLLAALILGIASPLARFYSEPRLFPIPALIAASYLLTPWNIVPFALLSRKLNLKATSLVNMSGAVTNSGCALAFAAFGFSAKSLAWAMSAQAGARRWPLNSYSLRRQAA